MTTTLRIFCRVIVLLIEMAGLLVSFLTSSSFLYLAISFILHTITMPLCLAALLISTLLSSNLSSKFLRHSVILQSAYWSIRIAIKATLRQNRFVSDRNQTMNKRVTAILLQWHCFCINHSLDCQLPNSRLSYAHSPGTHTITPYT